MKNYKLKHKYQVKLNQLILISVLFTGTYFIIDKTPFSFKETTKHDMENIAYAENNDKILPSAEQEESIEKETIVEPEPLTNNFVFNEKIPMTYEHQESLYIQSLVLDLDYSMLLAIIATESDFDPNVIGPTNDYGYFQINKVNHSHLADVLGTPNQPLDPIINILWGTYMLADLFEYWSNEGLVGDRLNHSVWSSYNKGLTGFKKYGFADDYISKIETNLQEIKVLLNDAQAITTSLEY